MRKTADGRNAAAVQLGRLGGLKGGKARAEKLTPEERSEIARKGAEARIEKMGQTRREDKPRKKKRR